MDQIFFCIHDKCNAQARVLLTMADVPNHQDKHHKVLQFKDLKAYVNQKFIDSEVNRMAKINNQEKALKDMISKIIKELKEQLELFELHEIKKMPSLETVLQHIWTVKKTDNLRDISNDMLNSLVEFQAEKLPKYATALEHIETRLATIRNEIKQMLKPANIDMTISILAQSKQLWSDIYKANIYQTREDKKEVEPTSSFLGWSFICTTQPMTMKQRYEIKLKIEEIKDQKTGPGQSRVKPISFALGVTHQKVRQTKGFEQQDLAAVGHGFYLLRSDGWTCHHVDKNVNWKSGLAFNPEVGVISMKFEPLDGSLTIEQNKHKYVMDKIEMINTDNYLFCAHLRGCKIMIVD